MAGYSSVAPVMGILQLSTICLKEQITCLLVELIGPKGVLGDTHPLLLPLGQMKRCWRAGKDRGKVITCK